MASRSAVSPRTSISRSLLLDVSRSSECDVKLCGLAFRLLLLSLEHIGAGVVHLTPVQHAHNHSAADNVSQGAKQQPVEYAPAVTRPASTAVRISPLPAMQWANRPTPTTKASSQMTAIWPMVRNSGRWNRHLPERSRVTSGP